MTSIFVQYPYGKMAAGDFDACPHTLQNGDRTDPHLAWCLDCGETLGKPSGGRCTILAPHDDPHGPFGQEVEE